MDDISPKLVKQQYSCIFTDSGSITERIENPRHNYDKDLQPPDDFLSFLGAYKLSPESLAMPEFQAVLASSRNDDEKLKTPSRKTSISERDGKTVEARRLKSEGSSSSHSKPQNM